MDRKKLDIDFSSLSWTIISSVNSWCYHRLWKGGGIGNTHARLAHVCLGAHPPIMESMHMQTEVQSLWDFSCSIGS